MNALRPTVSSHRLAAVVGGALFVAALPAGCGSGSGDGDRAAPGAAPRPDVARRVASGRELFGLPAFPDARPPAVRTDPSRFSADAPGLYAAPERAVAALRRDGFVAGVVRVFKAPGRPDGATSTVVQMRDAAGAAKEFRRELASVRDPACPRAGCRHAASAFPVAGVAGAVGVRFTIRMPPARYSEHPDVLRGEAIVFRRGAFVHQVFLGATPTPGRRRALIAAARAQAARRWSPDRNGAGRGRAHARTATGSRRLPSESG